MKSRKICSKCGVEKHLLQFNYDKTRPDNRYPFCKLCARKACRVSYHAHLEKRRKWNRDNALKSRYGVTREQVRKMFDAQNGRCLICWKSMEFPEIDHSHITKKIRGLLCGNCNRGLGLFFDSSETLRRAIGYLSLSDNFCGDAGC